jgi:hypothetical protein
MPHHTSPTAASLRIDPVASLIHVNAFDPFDPDGRLRMIAVNIRKCRIIRVNAPGCDAAELILFVIK